MPSVFGMEGDNDDLKPWEEDQAFQRSEQMQIQRGPMNDTPQGPQVFWWSLAPVSSQNGLHWSFFTFHF